RAAHPGAHVHGVLHERVRLDFLGHRVVRRSRIPVHLEALLQDLAGEGRARVHRESRRAGRKVTQRVVDALLLAQVVERPGAGWLSRHVLAEARPGFVREERVLVRQAEVPLDVAHAAFAADAELHALEPAARLGLDADDAVAGARAVHRGARGALDDLD